MPLVPGINGGGSSYKQICAMESSSVSHGGTARCKRVAAGAGTDRRKWLAEQRLLWRPCKKQSFLAETLCSSVSLAEEINQCVFPKIYNHGFWNSGFEYPLCMVGRRSFLLLVNQTQLKNLQSRFLGGGRGIFHWNYVDLHELTISTLTSALENSNRCVKKMLGCSSAMVKNHSNFKFLIWS